MSETTTSEIPFVYNVGEAAKYIGISRITAYKRIAAGEFPKPHIEFYTKKTGNLENVDPHNKNHNKYWTEEQLKQVKEDVSRHRALGRKKPKRP